MCQFLQNGVLIFCCGVFFWCQEKFALCASTHRFLTVTTDDKIMAVSEKAKEKEVMTVIKHTCIHMSSTIISIA